MTTKGKLTAKAIGYKGESSQINQKKAVNLQKSSKRSVLKESMIPSKEENKWVEEMNEELKESYDNFLYLSMAFSNTNINSLQARGRIYGLDPVPLKGARVLELGCACGGNIIPQAIYYPDTTFVGIDLSGVQIKHGQELIKSMGLSNITLLEKNIMDIEEDFGSFDYIIVHGIWSWVPDVVKDKILSICNKNLSDSGIAYVSYNTYPGWKRLEQLRDIMLYSERQAPSKTLQDRTVYTKNVLQLIQKTMKIDERSYKQSEYKINNIQRILSADDCYVAHEYLAAINDPAYISEFVKRAEAQGCSYIGDECLQRSFISWLSNDVVNNINTLAQGNHIDKEQYYDYIYDTQFRRALLTKCCNKDRITRDETVKQSILNSLYFLTTDKTARRVPPEWTNKVQITIQELMNTNMPFSIQDIISYIEEHYPGYQIDTQYLYTRILLLIVIDHLYTFGEKYDHLTFKDNESYVPEIFIKYITSLVEGGGSQYITASDMYNQIYDVDEDMLYIMRLMAKPTSRGAIIADLDKNVTVQRVNKDGQQFRVPSDQYLDEVLVQLQALGFLRNKNS